MDSILYVGADDGVVTARSRDGRSWEIENRGLQGWAIPGLTSVPGAPNQVLAGTRGDGVWLSEDFGKSWKKPSYGKRGPGKVRCVTVAPDNPRRVYAGTEPIDVFVSEDLGATWRRCDSVWDDPFIATIPYPVPTVEPHVRDIAIDPQRPDTIYAALQVGYIVKSADGGETWRLLNQGLDCDVHTIVIDPADPGHIVIATGGHDARLGRAPGRALYMTEDGGESWAPVALNIEQEYSVPLVQDPRDPRTLFSAVANGQPSQWRRPTGAESSIVRSRDGGRTWQRIALGDGKGFAETILVDDEHPGRVYAGCRDGAFFISEDGGDSWERLDLTIPGVADAALVHV